MDRFLQMTFIPQIENTWNFFVWLTDDRGKALSFSSLLSEKESVPDWLTATSAYPYFPYQTKFVDGKDEKEVNGIIMPMARVFQLIRDEAFYTHQTDLYPGLTIQWFRQISEALAILLENGHFYPFFYHLNRGKNDQCYFCHWIPDAHALSESGLFADWLSRLPQLAFSIEELQDQKVQQWLYLVVIYWLNAMIRALSSTTDAEGQSQIESMTHASPISHEIVQQQVTSGHPLLSFGKPWLIVHDPKDITQMEKLEFEMAGWVRTVSANQQDSWTQALLNYKREQMENYFEPERAEIVLKPADPTNLFSQSALWSYAIKIFGWQNGHLVKQSPEQLEDYSTLDEKHSWLFDRLQTVKSKVSKTLMQFFDGPSEGFLTVNDLSEFYQYETVLSEASIDVSFPKNIDIEDASDSISIDLDIHPSKFEDGPSLFSLASLISYDWRIAIGDMQLSAEDFKQLVQANQPFIHQGTKWIHLPMQQIMKAYQEMADTLDLFDKTPTVSSAMKLEATRRRKRNTHLSIHLDANLDNYLSNLLKKPSRTVPLPDAFIGQLRPYQKKGYTWLVNLRHRRVGGCLADDMGLGKTVQAIAYLDYCKQNPEQQIQATGKPNAPALIICPTSLVANWKHECATFSPQLKIYIHHGSDRLRGPAFRDQLNHCDVVITSYAIYTKEASELLNYYWNCVILDEAQAIKNPHAQKTRALRPIQTAHRLVLTGTPIENHLEELWSIMDFLNPGYLGALERFRKQFIHPVEKKNSRSKASQLTRMIRPFLLRREKTDKKIIHDLPEKVEAKRICNLTKNQASLYQSIVNRLKKNVVQTGGIQRKGLILSTLTKLKQVCDHPSLVSDQPTDDQTSGKLNLFFHILEPLFEQDEKVLVFTQYIQMGKILLEETQRRHPDAEIYFLHGALSADQRQKMIENFQNPTSKKSLFILSLKAGGVGINLTAAGYVIHYDRWWNPAVEEQATDRAYRIGQERNVYVYKLICEGTLEERIDQLIEQKKNLQKQILSGGESWLTEMSDQELMNLIQLHEGVL
ncbi:SNF2-related protein [Sporolactobacillus kofuensis]|uniref:SNF2-related protein n=1 Tax=Sporolactobacillus kofuensis TaxID=269672 RepID=A0ABW1WFF0_9BACL|nr:DEAD/DEAH box helicase [Sporolactobacillus kofuensis]MCO7176076.1 DEAD/DEAH box helicase [Sporolactobacillus kofuensis]